MFFLKKIGSYILPYCDILAWCLMPNHFHLMVRVNQLEIEANSGQDHQTKGFASSETLGNTKQRTLNDSIGLMLRSYTNAINKQQNRTGSLFRKNTKAACINCPDGITKSWLMVNGIVQINVDQPEQQYPQLCYSYILNNPVSAGLVPNAEDWEFSSARDIMGLRNGKLINREVINEYGLEFKAI